MAQVPRIAAIVITLTLIGGGLAWYQADPATRQAILSRSGQVLGWLGVVGLLPWCAFLLIAWVGRMGSNLAGAALVIGFTLLELGLLLWLVGVGGHGKTGWIFITAGALLAGVYNLFICDWIAEKLE
jgi:hypothetical protein